MKIGIVVPWEEATPPAKYGGIELVAHNIVLKLSEMGHDVTTYATGDSTTKGKIDPIFPNSTRQLDYSGDKMAREAYTFLGISRVIEKINNSDADIIHNHMGWRLLLFRKLIQKPMITTIHLSLDNPYEKELYKLVKNHPFVSISLSQREPLPDLNYVANIYDGIEINKFAFNPIQKGNYLAFLGSFTKHKGPHTAIKVALETGKKLIMAGKVDPLEQSYFKKHIEPYIDGDQISFIGEVDHQQKNEILMNADALLMPIEWREPFGLVITEAMASGTPVIAFNKGSVPEIISNGKNGYVCETFDEMVDAVDKIHKIDRESCRQTVQEKFSAQKMTEQYLVEYEKIIKQR